MFRAGVALMLLLATLMSCSLPSVSMSQQAEGDLRTGVLLSDSDANSAHGVVFSDSDGHGHENVVMSDSNESQVVHSRLGDGVVLIASDSDGSDGPLDALPSVAASHPHRTRGWRKKSLDDRIAEAVLDATSRKRLRKAHERELAIGQDVPLHCA